MFKLQNIAYICGQAAGNVAHKIVGKLWAFAQYPQNTFIYAFTKSYTSFYTSGSARVCTQKFMHFISVNGRFYTLYTAPTITTTLNN